MKVILQQNVIKLGKAGDIVEASPGYFRNFLQPRKLAVVASEGTLKKREEDLDSLKKKADAAHQESVSLAEKINALETIILNVKAGEGGKLYGKITNKEIAQALEKQIGTPVDKRLVRPLEDIGALGIYKVAVKLTAEVQAQITVEVQPEGGYPKKEKPAAPVETTEEGAEEASAEEPAAG
jgi:large subunit ribosomal protein L9